MRLVIFGDDRRLGVVRNYNKRDKIYSVCLYNSSHRRGGIMNVLEVDYELVPGGIIYNNGIALVFVKFESTMSLNVPEDIMQHWLEYRRGVVNEECV